MKFRSSILMSLAAAIVLAGCGNTALERKAELLSAAANGSTAKVEAYYDKLNAEHRKMIVIETDLKLGSVSSLNTDEAISDRSKKIRVKSMEVIEKYCGQLKLIATAKTCKEISVAVTNLNNKISALADQMPDDAPGGLKGVVQKLAISKALDTVVKGSFWIFRDNWLRSSIQDSREAMKKITTTLEADLNGASTEVKAEASIVFADLKTYLNDNEDKLSKEDRAALMKNIEEALTRKQTVTNDSPVDAIENIRNLHTQLADITDEEIQKRRRFVPWGGK